MIIFKTNIVAQLIQEILILRRSFPTTSYVAATFHPTIGQCAHQSLSITATLELGMISTRNQETTGLHTTRPNTHSQANTQLGFTDYPSKLINNWVSQAIKATRKHIHSSMQHIHKTNSLQRLSTRILILKRSWPATSYVVAMFHPTIGQCAHQYLSITATPDLGMISTRNQGTTDLHKARPYIHSQANTQLGFTDCPAKQINNWVSQDIKLTSQ